MTTATSPSKAGRLSEQEIAEYKREGFIIYRKPVFAQAKFDALKAHFEEKLARLRMTGMKLVDADLLLAQLRMVAGEKDELGDAMKKEEAQAALDELKKKTT